MSGIQQMLFVAERLPTVTVTTGFTGGFDYAGYASGSGDASPTNAAFGSCATCAASTIRGATIRYIAAFDDLDVGDPNSFHIRLFKLGTDDQGIFSGVRIQLDNGTFQTLLTASATSYGATSGNMTWVWNTPSGSSPYWAVSNTPLARTVEFF